MPPGSHLFRPAASDCTGGDLLIVFAIAQKNLPDFEQRDVPMTAVGIALSRRDQPRQQARPHVG